MRYRFKIVSFLFLVICVTSVHAFAKIPTERLNAGLKTPPEHHARIQNQYELLSTAVNRIVESSAPLEKAAQLGFIVVNDRVQVTISTNVSDIEDYVSFLVQLDALNILKHETLLRADVYPSDLVALTDHPGTAYIRKPDYLPMQQQVQEHDNAKVLAISEGVQAMNANQWHALGFEGQGLKIGVLDLGFAGYQGLIGTELPSASQVHYQRFSTYASSEEHGTACAEIIHDVAPAAELFLAEIADPLFEGAAAVDWMYNQGVDILTISLAVPGLGPGDGHGWFADALNSFHQAGRLVYVSAGNHRLQHWQGRWSDPNANGYHNFSPDYELNHITENGSEPVYLPAGIPYSITLSWNEWTNPTTDLDLCVFFEDGNGNTATVACSELPQNGQPGQFPIEKISAVTPYSGFYSFFIWKYSGSGSPDMEVFLNDGAHPLFSVADGSLTVPADGVELTAVAAIDAGGSYPLEPYSSRGPTNGPGGSLSGGFVKPDIAGYANVSTAAYGPRSSGQAFNGTSSACPHAAGAAAIVWSAYPGWSNNQVRSYLLSHAIDMGPGGKDNDTGYGRLYLGAPPQSCTYSISPTSQGFGSSGGSGSISVSTQSGCTWTASESLSWVNITSGASGNGSGTVNFSVASNGNANSRSGSIQVAGRTFSITQEGATSCSYSISPSSTAVGASGGTGNVSVSTTSGCTWTAISNNAWISVTSGSSGNGSGSVGYEVASNGSPSQRSGTITIANRTFTVTQSGATGGGSENYMVAGIAHANGTGGSVWRSTMAVTNRSGGPANLTLTYRFTGGTRNQNLTLQNARIVEWVDVASSLFGVGGTSAGSVEVSSSRPVIVTARTYNVGSDGTFGQFLPGADDGNDLNFGETGILPQVKKTSAFRTNIGFVNLKSSSVTVRTKLFSNTGSQLGNTITTTIAGNQWKQENDVFQKATVSFCELGYATVEVSTSGGSVWAYASVVDEGTGDPTTIPVNIQ